HFLGIAGMPRRIPDYSPVFTEFNMISSIGAFGFGLSQLLLLWVVVKAIRGGARASDRVWENAHGLEWTVPSPAPFHTFETPPVVK
ncbi:MAG: cytochrome c oxidase subunit I, partial [Desulfobulbaceae bacterium]